MPDSAKRPRGARAAALAASAALLLAVMPGCKDAPPDQTQSAERIRQIQHLTLQRTGRVRIQFVSLDGGAGPGAVPTPVHYLLRSPLYRVQDTDIRGYMDGREKYRFNQGTAYHMRVGRRINSAHKGELELKRTLVRWTLPDVPEGARVRDARLTLWVEELPYNSPLLLWPDRLPVHLYAYPLDPDWGPGEGGTGHDSFSDAAPGEADWNQARAGQRPWPAPGALAPGEAPIGMGLITGGDRRVVVEGEGLARYVERCLRQHRSFDVLLKLADAEEDRWGTELALLASDFGDDKDLASKRPTLEFDATPTQGGTTVEAGFELEPGGKQAFGPFRLAGPRALLAAAVVPPEGDGGGAPPRVWVRGGTGQPTDLGHWTPFDVPEVRDWDWFQVMLSGAPFRVPLGDDVTLTLREFWVRPGPREAQRPNMVVVAPSGRAYVVDARAEPDTWYRIDFSPDEPGLWRYGWSFLPTPDRTPGSHQGEGLFFAEPPSGPAEVTQLKAFAERLVAELKAKKETDPTDQARINALVRWAAVYGHGGPAQKKAADQVLAQLRAAVPEKFHREW
jgi:hypothetical protein